MAQQTPKPLGMTSPRVGVTPYSTGSTLVPPGSAQDRDVDDREFLGFGDRLPVLAASIGAQSTAMQAPIATSGSSIGPNVPSNLWVPGQGPEGQRNTSLAANSTVLQQFDQMLLRSGRVIRRPLMPARRARSGSVGLDHSTVPLSEMLEYNLFQTSVDLPQLWPHPLPTASRWLNNMFSQPPLPAESLQEGGSSPVLMIDQQGSQTAVAETSPGSMASIAVQGANTCTTSATSSSSTSLGQQGANTCTTTSIQGANICTSATTIEVDGIKVEVGPNTTNPSSGGSGAMDEINRGRSKQKRPHQTVQSSHSSSIDIEDCIAMCERRCHSVPCNLRKQMAAKRAQPEVEFTPAFRGGKFARVHSVEASPQAEAPQATMMEDTPTHFPAPVVDDGVQSQEADPSSSSPAGGGEAAADDEGRPPPPYVEEEWEEPEYLQRWQVQSMVAEMVQHHTQKMADDLYLCKMTCDVLLGKVRCLEEEVAWWRSQEPPAASDTDHGEEIWPEDDQAGQDDYHAHPDECHVHPGVQPGNPNYPGFAPQPLSHVAQQLQFGTPVAQQTTQLARQAAPLPMEGGG